MEPRFTDERSTQDLLTSLMPCVFFTLIVGLCCTGVIIGAVLYQVVQPEDIIPAAPVPQDATQTVDRYEWGTHYSDEFIINLSLEGVGDFYEGEGATCEPEITEVISLICTGQANPIGTYTARIFRQVDIELPAGYPSGETIIYLQVGWE